MQLIDTHCHLTVYDEEALKRVLLDSHTCHVTKQLCIGASDGVASAKQAVTLSEQHSTVWASIGIHPHDAGNYITLEDIASLATHPRVLAIGETGLDFFREWAPFDAQRTLFANSIALAKEVKKPLIIHCRDAHDETLKILKEQNASEVGGVFHCYAETAEFAKKLSDINFNVSLTGIITFKNAHALRKEIEQIPLSQIMLETDCPYMAPEPFRGQKSEPKHVFQIAHKLAEIKGIDVTEIARITTENAQKLFQF
jgi:TatD DNase family protein